ncbi:testis-expressed sequence 2 protein-like isoform X2 [Stegastes partitus]|uniref:Testis-expressed sequence 2 protein-like isoform X2 n=1 Tax=Stegastes partitus TaxID=144197 RepID=A0A9Y4NML6_9TELE|nr:PREDICTED: testis-expressed sequence 2 protein-like isoform X2 [Stegastes partitus]
MTSRHPSHAESTHSSDKQPPAVAPKLHVHRSLSKETITIHFSALGKEEEEEEEELYTTTVSATSAALDDSNIVTALEASEEMFEGVPVDSAAGVGVIPESSRLSPISRHHTNSSPTRTLSSHASEQKASTSNSSPTKSLSFPSSDKPFLSMVKSLSSDAESRDGVSPIPAPSVRHRHLMKTLVKSLSIDTSQDSSSSSSSSSSSTPYRLPESRLNLQLFKQFTQSRIPSAAASSLSDSKTAPSSPLTSPDNRSFFKVSEVEARIEDTKRRLSEAISEPLQLLSKIMDEKSGSLVGSSIYRPKALSASASELSNIASVNGHLESNNNYCIKEEEGGDWEAEGPNSRVSGTAESPVSLSVDTKSPNKSSPLSMSLDKCSMSALAKQEDEDFCILYSDDFDTCTETDGDGVDRTDNTGSGSQTKVPLSGSTEPCSEDESESIAPAPSVPHYTLSILTVLVYGYFVLPLPSYVGGMLLGIGLGFLLAIGVVWLTGPKPSGGDFRHSRHRGEMWSLTKLDIKEPEIYKGWMNEILNYDPETYHATLTHSVYVRLEGSIIRLSKPNHNIARRATHNEPKPDVTYISQKIYDLTNSKVYLAPQSLARKRIWNKKYPICIELGKQDDFMSKAEGDRWEASEGVSTRDRGEATGGGQDRGWSSSARDLTLYLFGRTGREKEEWFQRFLSASKLKADLKKSSSVVGSKKALSSHSRSSSRSSLDEALASQPRPKDSSASSTMAASAKAKPLLDYSVYMGSLLPKQLAVSPTAASPVLQSPQSSPGADKKLQSTTSAPLQPRGEEEEEEDAVAWVNAALGRVFWDFLTEPYWAELVSKKIQMKLSKIRLPYFMNELTLTELDMGSATPRILGASKPSIDYRGLWFDLEISYRGSFLMTLETKMNLIRLGKEGDSLRLGEFGKDGPRTYCLADSDEESSSAGSSDEEDSSDFSNDSAGADGLVGGHKASKIMRFVDKITKSKYFQKATETEFIKKKMEEVSNTPLLLTVEVQQLRGTLAVNIPPPPTDRIWYGFRTPPHLELKARPKLGEREVTLAHVTDWIEKKLDQEFQKILVMPNMDDVWLTIMHSAMDPRSAGGPSVGLPAADPEPWQPERDSTSQP